MAPQNGRSGEGALAALDSSMDEDSSDESQDGDSMRHAGGGTGGAADASRADEQAPLPLLHAQMRLQVMAILWANWEVCVQYPPSQARAMHGK